MIRPDCTPPCHPRSGVTLAEILMSMLIMGIGVVAVASIFPISVLRSVAATNLTNAVALRDNVDALRQFLPEVNAGGATWQTGHYYSSSPIPSYVLPSSSDARMTLGPYAFKCTAGGNAGNVEPNFDISQTTISESTGVKWQPVYLPGYVIDPLGVYKMDFTSAWQSSFGSEGLGTGNAPLRNRLPSTYYPRMAGYRQEKFNGSNWVGLSALENQLIGEKYSNLQDSWVTVGTTTTLTYDSSAGTLALSNLTGDISNIPTDGQSGATRAIIYDSTMRNSEVRDVNGLSGATTTSGTISLANALPNGFTPYKVAIEVQELRYTWMITGKVTPGGSRNLSVVVFFRREFNPNSERVYPAYIRSGWNLGIDNAAGIKNIDDDGDQNTDNIGEIGALGSDDQYINWMIVNYPSANDRPAAKAGAFVCDYGNLNWYRISSVIDEGLTPAQLAAKVSCAPNDINGTTIASQLPTSGLYMLLKLDGDVRANGNVIPDATAPGNPNAKWAGAMIMRNVVEVFPLKSSLPWDDQ